MTTKAEVVRIDYTGDQFAQDCPQTESVVATYTRDEHGADYYGAARRQAERLNGFGNSRGPLPMATYIVRRS